MKNSRTQLTLAKTVQQNLRRNFFGRAIVFSLVSLFLLAAVTSLKAATTFTATTNATGNWNAAASWAGGTIPAGAGNIAVQGAASVTRTLNVATTIGQVKNTQGSGRLFTVSASGAITMTMDNTGGTTNVAGDFNAFIGSTSSGGLVFTPNIVIQNTDLDVYQNGSTQPSDVYGTLGSSTITATSARNLFLLQTYTGGKSITINHSIGGSGSVITVQNKGAGNANPGVILAGVVGPNAAVIQNSPTCSLQLSAANTYTGGTTISAGTLILSASGSLSASSSVSIAAGGTFDVSAQTTFTLGSSATLSASGTAAAATIRGGTTVSLGSRPVTLTFDGSNPALTLATGTLSLNNNTFTVVVSGSALAAGTYTLVATPGAITGSPNATPVFGGNGIVSGATGTISKSGNNLILTVASGGGGPITIQAETGALSGATPPVIETINGGFNGTAYVNMMANTSTLTLNNVSGNGGGAKNLAIRYALGAATARTCNLIVNGVTQAITFAPTGSWTNWTTLNASVTLNNNTANTIAFTTTGSDAGNIDEITIPSTGGGGGPGPVSASHSTVSPATASIAANGTSTQIITVQARDTNNVNETSGGATVVFSRSGTGTLSGTTDVGNGTYRATLTSPASAGLATVTATLNGTSVGTAVGASQSVVTFTATNTTTVNAAHSTITPPLASLTANGGSTQTITVQARDGSDNNITTGGATVVFARSGTGTISGTTDNGNGTYTATLTAPAGVGSGTITATLNGTSVGTLVNASQCAATYFSTNFGDAIFGLTAAQFTNFTVGGIAFNRVQTVASGLGPIFNNSGCANCHNFPVAGGSGSATVVRFGLNTNGVFNPLTSLGGSLLQDNSTTTNFETVPASANVSIRRSTQPCFGMGLMEAIADNTIQTNAAAANADGIVGVVSLVTDPIDGHQHVGRFGWKAQQATLLAFTADAANNEVGITSRIFPVGQAPNGNTTLYNQLNTVADPNDNIDGTGKADIDRDADFQRFLSPPPTLPLTANAIAGKALFTQIRCDICHTPSLPTSPAFIPVSDLASVTNTVITALSSKSVPLYSDLLLHKMGALADGIAQASAATNQMRTAPLWGLRQSLPYLHDGRAFTVDAAIRAHAGDAALSQSRYVNLSTNQQSQLVEFLNSL